MRFTNLFCPTLREVPGDAEVVSHQLLLRAGFIKKLAQGIYSLMPLGQRVIRKVEQVIREEMNKVGAQEVFMPSVIPAELWMESGRWYKYGKELLRFKDRHDKDYCFGPTHEEVITDMVRNNVKSYRQLPVHLYQIQTKFRDEIRPRFGLMRGREFIMKDAYSFHASYDDLDKTYHEMEKAYTQMFARLGLVTKGIEADSGAIGGSVSKEFVVISDTGEDQVVECLKCGYVANLEMAENSGIRQKALGTRENSELEGLEVQNENSLELVSTPNVTSIEDLSLFFNLPAKQFIKAVFYLADQKPVIIFVRGDHTVNEVKVMKILNCNELIPADEKTIQEVTGAESGFTGPINLQKEVPLYFDIALKNLENLIMGANKKDFHFKNVNVARDINPKEYFDLRFAEQGDACSRCKEGQYQINRGIELGHVFKLGDKYSKAMNAVFLDQNGKEQPYIMGCYGIGVGRTMASVVEQNYDKDGIIWPISSAPYLVDFILANTKDEELKAVGERIYQDLLQADLEIVYDDRDESAGIKFKDADLIGFPIQVILGNKYKNEQFLELRLRKDKQNGLLLRENDLVAKIKEILNG